MDKEDMLAFCASRFQRNTPPFFGRLSSGLPLRTTLGRTTDAVADVFQCVDKLEVLFPCSDGQPHEIWQVPDVARPNNDTSFQHLLEK